MELNSEEEYNMPLGLSKMVYERQALLRVVRAAEKIAEEYEYVDAVELYDALEALPEHLRGEGWRIAALKEREHTTDGTPCWCEPVVEDYSTNVETGGSNETE